MITGEQLPVPETVPELVKQLTASENNMFTPITGVPRAFMQFPVDQGQGETFIVRWLYRMFSPRKIGTAEECEAALCKFYWEKMIALRKCFEAKYPDGEPLIVWRRVPVLEAGTDLVAEQRRVQIYSRFVIPGLTDRELGEFLGGEEFPVI